MGITGTQAAESDYTPIGDTLLEGCVFHGNVWVRGPCGAGHVMTPEHARQLVLWLNVQLASFDTLWLAQQQAEAAAWKAHAKANAR